MENSQIIFYATPNGNIKVEVVFESEIFWLTQKAIALLVAVEIPAISKHLTNIFETNELQKELTNSILETVQKEDSGYQVANHFEDTIAMVSNN